MCTAAHTPAAKSDLPVLTRLSTIKSDQLSLNPSADSESFVLYLKPYIALLRLSIEQSLGGKTSQHHLVSPAAAVLSNESPLSCVQLLITVKPLFTNASDHEQFGLRTKFSEHKASRMTYCVSSYEHASRQKRQRIPFQTITFHFLTTFHSRRQLSSIQVR